MSDFAKMIKKHYGDDVHMGTQDLNRWDTGFYALNSSLGGGLPAARINLLVGKQSTGKSTIAAKVAGVVNSTDYETGKFCGAASSSACKVLYMDQEGSLKRDYCEKHNYIPEGGGNVVMTTKTGNQCVDVINSAIQSGEFSLIILDSLEALIPYKDLEKSSEDFTMGTKAKMNNDAFRRWGISMIASSRKYDKWWQRPTFLVINQLRESISSTPMPPQIPGGIGQLNAASTIIQMNSPKYKDDNKLASIVTLRGVVKKNKTATPRGGFECDMAVKSMPELGMDVGAVDNALYIIKDVRKHGLWFKDEDGKWDLFGHKADKQDEFYPKMLAEPDFELEIMQKTIEALK